MNFKKEIEEIKNRLERLEALQGYVHKQNKEEKKEPKFKAGDKVIYKGNHENRTGSIATILTSAHFLGVNSYDINFKDGEWWSCDEKWLELYTEKFTEDEKVILRNLPEEYEWIAKDGAGIICFFKEKPKRAVSCWWTDGYFIAKEFDYIFQSIKWEDEPVKFRDYL